MPGSWACGGQFTTNTMATACQMLGISPMAANDIPASHADKAQSTLRQARIRPQAVAAHPWLGGRIGRRERSGVCELGVQ
ncbi:dihydroxy-acid dehydratase [Methylobacterium nonmethylotrophicum]|uniref:Dihydroxy-acid/6-phosphogluconate dehydratase N-terminal domain-containing protein n=1 Tax=Methylobacterium nonmethylotrophicum TaxID=1141884 RepID=A0A4Z0NQF6_9HYPH|nr:dihydroxy-acid dehydratase [Methylobacterium nonmethylotrophicum]TGD98672.1 hypothetical protein EU555_15135 [Methylobacterium nonmethylotrophicum]